MESNQEIGLELGRQRWAAGSGDCSGVLVDHGGACGESAVFHRHQASRKLDLRHGVGQLSRPTRLRPSFGCRDPCGCTLRFMTPADGPAAPCNQPGSAEPSWEQPEEVPGWSAYAAAGPEFQSLCTDEGLGRRIGKTLSGRPHRRVAGCGGSEQEQQCSDGVWCGKPERFSSGVDRCEDIEVEDLDGRTAMSLSTDSFGVRSTGTVLCHCDRDCTRCRRTKHSQSKDWTPGAGKNPSQPLGSMSLPVHTIVPGTWSGLYSTPFSQSTALKEPACSGLASSCDSDPGPVPEPLRHTDSGQTGCVRSSPTGQRRRDVTLPTPIQHTLLVYYSFSSAGLSTLSTFDLERTGAGVGEEEPAAVITSRSGRSRPQIRSLFEPGLSRSSVQTTSLWSASSSQPAESIDSVEAEVRLARQRADKMMKCQPAESIDSAEARMWLARQRAEKQYLGEVEDVRQCRQDTEVETVLAAAAAAIAVAELIDVTEYSCKPVTAAKQTAALDYDTAAENRHAAEYRSKPIKAAKRTVALDYSEVAEFTAYAESAATELTAYAEFKATQLSAYTENKATELTAYTEFTAVGRCELGENITPANLAYNDIAGRLTVATLAAAEVASAAATAAMPVASAVVSVDLPDPAGHHLAWSVTDWLATTAGCTSEVVVDGDLPRLDDAVADATRPPYKAAEEVTVSVPDYGTWYSGLDGDESGGSHHTHSSDDIGMYTDYEEDMYAYMRYGVPLPGMPIIPQTEQRRTSEETEEEVWPVSGDAEDPGWGLTAPHTVSGTNPGTSQGCDSYSAIIMHLPERRYTINMISTSKSVGRGRRRDTEDTVKLPGKLTVSTAGMMPGSMEGPTDQQEDIRQLPPTDHSNKYVKPFCGNDNIEASWRASTTRHDLDARLEDEQQFSMPRLSHVDEVAQQRCLEAKRREYDLMLEVERLRYERSMAEEIARQDVMRVRIELESERLRAAQDRLGAMQLSAVGDVASTGSSAQPSTPIHFGPLDSSAEGAVQNLPLVAKRLDRRSAGVPPAGAEAAIPFQSGDKPTAEACSKTAVPLPQRSVDTGSGQDVKTRNKLVTGRSRPISQTAMLAEKNHQADSSDSGSEASDSMMMRRQGSQPLPRVASMHRSILCAQIRNNGLRHELVPGVGLM